MKKIIYLTIMIASLLMSTCIAAYAYAPVSVAIPVEIKGGGTAVIIPEVNCPVPDKSEMTLYSGEIGRFNIEFSETGVYTYTVKLAEDEKNIHTDKTVYVVKIFVTEDENGELRATVVAYVGERKYSGLTSGGIYGLVFTNPEKDTKPSPETEPETDPYPVPVPTPVPTPTPVPVPVPVPVPDYSQTLTVPSLPEYTETFTLPSMPDYTEPVTEPAPPDETEPVTNPSSEEETASESRTEDGRETERHNPDTRDDTDMEIYFLIAMFASAGLLMLSIVHLSDTRKMTKEQSGQNRHGD